MKLKVPIEKKAVIDGGYPTRNEMTNRGAAYGFNECLDQLEQCEVCFDEEKLAEQLFWIQGISSKPELRKRAWECCRRKEEFYKTAKAIIAAMPSIMSVKRSET